MGRKKTKNSNTNATPTKSSEETVTTPVSDKNAKSQENSGLATKSPKGKQTKLKPKNLAKEVFEQKTNDKQQTEPTTGDLVINEDPEIVFNSSQDSNVSNSKRRKKRSKFVSTVTPFSSRH